MKRLLLDIFYIILFCIIWYSAIRIWYWYDAKNGPNILFQKKPNIDSLEAAIQDLPKDVKFLIFQLTGCGLIFYFIFYFSSFIATGKGFIRIRLIWHQGCTNQNCYSWLEVRIWN